MKILKVSTAATIAIGNFVDTAGAAATGLTLTQTDIILSKGGSTTFAAKNDSTSATHRSGGVYTAPLDATDTGTLGLLTVVVNKTGALPYKETWTVVPANVYDSLIAGSDYLQADVFQIADVTANATKLAASASSIVQGTVDTTVSPSTTEFEAADITEATADHYKGRVVLFTSGAMAGQASDITAYALASGKGHFTVSTMTEAPANGVTFVIV